MEKITNTKHYFTITYGTLNLHKTIQNPWFLLSFPIFMVMETEKKFFVYADFREDDGRPFYVGKGSENRAKDLDRNQLHANIKNKHGMVRKIVFETYSEQEAFVKEIELIQELKTHVDFGEGGANFTLGGEGVSGYKYSEEQKEKRSKLSKKMWEDPEYRENVIESIKMAHNDPEVKKRRSKNSKKMWEDPEHKKLMSESLKKLWEDPEYKEKMSEISKKMWEDPKFQEKRRESHRKVYEKPEIKEKLSKNSKKMWEDPNHREKMSESLKKLWEDPEHKEKVSDAIKQHHSDPEFRKKQGEKMREVLSDPEIREKISKITKEKLSDPEIRKKISENVKLGISKLTPEQRSERIRKGWETRRLKKLQQES